MRFHGGSFWVKRKVIDFSVNTNPLGVPAQLEEAISRCSIKDVYSTYPDYNYTELKNAIAYFYNIEPRNIVACNGASEALNLSIIALKPQTLIIVAPSYGDYELLCRGLNIKCVYEIMIEREDGFEIDFDKLSTIAKNLRNSVIILTNPNNPTGMVIPENFLKDLARELHGKAWIIVDEVYSELSNYRGLLGDTTYDNIIVVRSFTKVFSIPGLRIGFIYTTTRKLLSTIDAIRPTWNINTIAECALKKALIEYKGELWRFIERSKKYVESERDYLSRSLIHTGYKVYLSL
ncbi:MAG: histidinol-phosphate transaminase, partial [Pyrodictiaceae archaeon]